MNDEASPTPDGDAGDHGGPTASVVDASQSGQPPTGPFTLAIDVGGTGIKASVLDAEDRMIADRVRVATTYPLAPERFVEVVGELIRPLPFYDRVAVGFPGVVRKGHIITAPHFVTAKGPGTTIVPDLVEKWSDFPAAESLGQMTGREVRIVNDADLQGLGVISGKGLEIVVTLGTGVGTGVFLDGVVAPHLELAHHRFRKGETYNEQLGEAAFEKVGARKWRARVLIAVENFRQLINFDHCFIGGGNARHLRDRVEAPYSIVDNVAGITGGIKLFEMEPF